MNKTYKKYGLLIIFFLLLVMDIFLLRLDWQHSQKVFTFAMLYVGQGDALFIESPTGAQILFDAGPARKILGPLARVMPPLDRTIDAIVITNPDADHIGGFLDILKNYKVDLVLEPGTQNSSKTFQNLKTEIQRQKIPNVLAKRGMKINLGGGAVIDILFPDRDVSSWGTNDGSVVARLSYGGTSVLLMGDATAKTEKIILEKNSSTYLRNDVLKVGHHGSRSSTYSALVQSVAPAYALISSGASNSYGHPHQEVLKTLVDAGAQIFRTDLLGTIILKSDGRRENFSFYK